jgi:hypothetical protein
MLLAHFCLGGLGAGKRALWLLRRYAGCHSSTQCWEERAVHHLDLVNRVREQTAPHDRLLVYSRNRDLACELAFYAFPRAVVMVVPDAVHPELENPGSVPVLKSAGHDCWAFFSQAGKEP